ncbi:hypothetical protein IAT38_007658 [Cryptococcus sp. DSM 104549]
MTTLDPAPSPSRDPFAKPKSASQNQSTSFSRTTLLPGIPSPVRPKLTTTALGSESKDGALGTPILKSAISVEGSAAKPRSSWRLLWRGGLEIGKEGWRLDGVTFFALLSFPQPSSSANSNNPFAFPTPPPSHSPAPSSPFQSLPGGATDICLSLESMRGRKHLQLRGVVDLPEDEVLEGDGEGEEGGGDVQMAIAPEAPVLAAYFTGLLCREGKLSGSGRTLSAVMIGLGDEEVDTTLKSTILVYGQRQDRVTNSPASQPYQEPGVLRLYVGRRKPPPPPPSEKKVRPGEPLPRGPLFMEKHQKPARGFARSISRSSVGHSIYHPPPSAAPLPAPLPSTSAPVSGRTPGRRGEKRPKKEGEKEDDRKRRAGRIVVPTKEREPSVAPSLAPSDKGRGVSATPAAVDPSGDEDEDIFGKRASSIAPPMSRVSSAGAGGSVIDPGERGAEGEGDVNGEPASAGKVKRARVPQQVLDNKASIRKQTMNLLDSRGIGRNHELFKDMFGTTTKGVYFAFRDQLQEAPISKADIQRIVDGHLQMYLCPFPPPPTYQGKEVEAESLVKVEVKEEYTEVSVNGLSVHLHEKEKMKLEAVVEEDEMELDAKE